MAEGFGGTGWVLMLSMLLLESGVQKDASMSIGVALDVVLMLMLMESWLLLRIDRIVGKVSVGE
jgi:hypothetical protein